MHILLSTFYCVTNPYMHIHVQHAYTYMIHLITESCVVWRLSSSKLTPELSIHTKEHKGRLMSCLLLSCLNTGRQMPYSIGVDWEEGVGVLLGIKLRTLCMPGKSSTDKLYTRPLFTSYFGWVLLKCPVWPWISSVAQAGLEIAPSCRSLLSSWSHRAPHWPDSCRAPQLFLLVTPSYW